MKSSNTRKALYELLAASFSFICAAGFIAFGYAVFFNGSPKAGGYGFLVAMVSFGFAYWFHWKSKDDGMGTGFGDTSLMAGCDD